MNHEITVLILQLAVLVITASLVGYVFDRWLKLPRVLGEVCAGMLVGPYMLGSIVLPGIHQPLFPIEPGMSVTVQLYGIAVLASIVLLFLAGLETDMPTFIRFSGVGSAVGVGGVICSFVCGAYIAVWLLPEVEYFFHPAALLLGSVATATSVGITARILSERKQMSSPEGVTILAAAVLDDVLGIILLAIVVALARVSELGVNWGQIGRIALRAFGFWLGSTLIGVLIAPYIVRGLKRFHSIDVIVSVAFGASLLLAGLAETAGLAMIIGAYVTGLALSRTDVADQIREHLHGLYMYLVPVFFAVMGLMVDFSVIGSVLLFGLVFAVFSIFTKLIGCGIPSLLFGFNLRGALRIGTGMLPRGEVTLIIAGVGLSAGILTAELFGVAVIVLLVSSVVAPPMLIQAFRGGSGYRDRKKDEHEVRHVSLQLESVSAAAFFRSCIIDAFRAQDFFVSRVDIHSQIYRIRQDDINITLVQKSSLLSLSTAAVNEQLVRLVLIDELAELKEVIAGLQKMDSVGNIENKLVEGLFNDD